MNLQTIWKFIYHDSRLHVAFTLFLVWLLALWQFATINALVYPLLAIAIVAGSDLLITWLFNHKLYVPTASLVTGFLIGLIIDPLAPIWILAIGAFAASLSKQLIKKGLRGHIFNPASFGLMTVALIFGTPIVWWSVAHGRWSLLILVPLMIRILWKLKRLTLPLGFLIIYFVYLLTRFDPRLSLETLIDGSVMLFALVMLPEPITSPAVGKLKYLYGPMVAILAILMANLKLLQDNFLPALLAANLLSFLLIGFGKAFAKTPETKTG